MVYDPLQHNKYCRLKASASDGLRCPFCGSDQVEERKEDWNELPRDNADYYWCDYCHSKWYTDLNWSLELAVAKAEIDRMKYDKTTAYRLEVDACRRLAEERGKWYAELHEQFQKVWDRIRHSGCAFCLEGTCDHYFEDCPEALAGALRRCPVMTELLKKREGNEL
jgi:hypothetical protein